MNVGRVWYTEWALEMEDVDDICLRVERRSVERKKVLGGEGWKANAFIGLGKELLDCRERRKRLPESLLPEV